MNARDWFNKARQEEFAIGAFNVDNLEIFEAVCRAGEAKKSPVMLEFSPGEVGYFGLSNICDLANNAREKYRIPILLNLDHSKNIQETISAIDAGFDDVHFDGSELEYSLNVENTKKIVELAHAKNLLVEGELNKLKGESQSHEEDIDLNLIKASYTDPELAAKFVNETGIDIFASVFGNVHGTFPNQPDLDFELLKAIKDSCGNTFLSLHGGSGIPADQVREAIKIGGIVKVNINTELRQAFHDALNEEVGENPNELAYYKLTPDIIEAVMAVVEGKIDILGSGGKA